MTPSTDPNPRESAMRWPRVEVYVDGAWRTVALCKSYDDAHSLANDYAISGETVRMVNDGKEWMP